MEDSCRKLVCYYLHRPDLLAPDEIDPFLCTHIVFAFAKIQNNELVENSPGDFEAYQKLVTLKEKNSKLKVLLSAQNGFPAMISGPSTEAFVHQAISFLRSHGFDGFDIDWEFPSASEKDRFTEFIKLMFLHMKDEAGASKKERLLLTATFPNSEKKTDGYDIKTVMQYLDYVTAMTYDFHVFSKSDHLTSYNSALFPVRGESACFCTEKLINYYLEQGVPPSKLLFGLPTYGRTYMLADATVHGLHAPAVDKGEGGPYLKKKGVYSYPEVCYALSHGGTRVWDKDASVPYLYSGKLWVTFEDEESSTAKATFFKDRLGGIGVWSLTLDDSKKQCGKKEFPIIRAAKAGFGLDEVKYGKDL